MESIYVIGCGAVGVPLMACLAAAGRRVVGVRASEEDAPEQTVNVPVTVDDQMLDLPLSTIGIGRLGEIKGPVVIATKAHANVALARRLAPLVNGPVVIMQNGLGVERPFVEAGFQEIYRSVLYVVSEGDLKKGFRFRAVTPRRWASSRARRSGYRPVWPRFIRMQFSNPVAKLQVRALREVWASSGWAAVPRCA